MCVALSTVARAQAPATAPAATAAAPPAAPADSELKGSLAKAPSTSDLAKGDPGGTITGTLNDVPVSDSKAGPTVTDVGTQVGQNKIAINFVWTLVTGFLVMFMQAGFAIVETGLTRSKSANHTM
ncbi:MAG: ammonium transporter, partial [Bryobacteraceae bacterium]